MATYKWTIFIANLNPVKGSEQRGNRLEKPLGTIKETDLKEGIENALRIYLNL